MQRRVLLAGVLAFAAAAAAPALAASVKVPMAMATATGPGADVGSVTFSDAKGGGVAVKLDLHGLRPGDDGFRVHEKPSCDAATATDGKVTPAGAAGAHLDPAATSKHLGPEGAGLLGDLPRVTVAADGTA